MLNYATAGVYREVALFEDWRPGAPKLDVNALSLSFPWVYNLFLKFCYRMGERLLLMWILKPLRVERVDRRKNYVHKCKLINFSLRFKSHCAETWRLKCSETSQCTSAPLARRWNREAAGSPSRSKTRWQAFHQKLKSFFYPFQYYEWLLWLLYLPTLVKMEKEKKCPRLLHT